jgi:hypothetical protein
MKKKRKVGKKTTTARRAGTRKARPSARGGSSRRKAHRRARVPAGVIPLGLPDEPVERPAASSVLTGGDVDADWKRAASIGEEAVGGTVATPDQDRVDEIGRALGVERSSTAPVVTSDEVLRDRDQRRWELERRADRRKDRT